MKQTDSNESQSGLLKTMEQYDVLIARMNKVIKGLKAYPKILTQPEHIHLHKIFDKILFNALCNLDLITELKYLDTSHAVGNTFETNFFARITAHSCFEILDNSNRIVGKEIIGLIKVKLGDETMKELNAHCKNLNRLKNQHSVELKKIRNNLFGHRVNAGQIQAEEMLKINPRSIYDIGNQIFKIQLCIQDVFLMKILPNI